MKIEAYEQAVEALVAIGEYCDREDGCIIAAISNGRDNCDSSLVGKAIDIIPALTAGILASGSFKFCIERALEASNVPEIRNAYFKRNPQNIEN